MCSLIMVLHVASLPTPRHRGIITLSVTFIFFSGRVEDALKDCDCLCLLTVSLGTPSTYVENVSITSQCI